MPIFGIPLQQVMVQQQAKHPTCKIPYFLKQGFKFIIRSGLDIEGLFRIAGPKSGIKDLKDTLDKGVDVDFAAAKTDITALGDVMKQFFREMPECLLLFSLYSKFLDVLHIPEKEAQAQELRSLVSQLPSLNQEVLRELLNFLRFLAINSSVNKMSYDNLGLVWGPNLLWSDPNSSSGNMLDILAGAGKIRFVVTIMLEEFDTIFQNRAESVETAHGIYEIGLVYKLVGHSKSVQGLVAVGDQIWSASSSGIIRVNSATDYKCITQIDTNNTRPFTLGTMHDYVFVGFANATKIYNTNFELVHELPDFSLAFLPVENWLWFASEQQIKILNMETFTVDGCIPLPKGLFALSLTYCIATGTVWVGCTNGHIVVINTKTYEIVKQLTTTKKNVDAVTVYNGERGTVQIWAGTGDGVIYVFNSKTYEVISQLRDANMMSVMCLASFGSTIWSCSRDSNIRIWDPEKLHRMSILDDYHTDAVTRVVFHLSNNHWFAWTSSLDKSVCVWSIALHKK
jgi:hypothetical protein